MPNKFAIFYMSASDDNTGESTSVAPIEGVVKSGFDNHEMLLENHVSRITAKKDHNMSLELENGTNILSTSTDCEH